MPTSAPTSRPRTATPRRSSGRRRRCRRRWSPRCAGASRRTIRACRSRTVRSPISGSIARAAQHELIGRTPRDGGDCPDRPRRRRAGQGVGLLQFRRHAAFAGPSPRSLERRPARLGVLHHPRAQLADRRGPARHRRADQRQRRVGPRFDVLLLCPRRRESPAAAGLPPSPGHGAERRRAGLRGEGQSAGSRASRKARAAASASSPPATRKPPSAG